ncbi:hypothetical protein VZH09_13410 [Synechococcus elongatus IITB7]|uniref:hypothetical protein n=1 Tax=Synechococcus elongatus TaxID=32046 RepID=UPI0030D27B50
MSGVAKLLLVLTSLSPGIATYGLATLLLGSSPFSCSVWGPIAIALFLAITCIIIINLAAHTLPALSVKVVEIKSADSEIVGFALAYVLPVLTSTSTAIDLRMLLLCFFSLAVLVWGTNSYHINPMLSLLGYHFYEIMSDTGITFVVLSKRTLRQVRSLKSVTFLTDYMALDLEER